MGLRLKMQYIEEVDRHLLNEVVARMSLKEHGNMINKKNQLKMKLKFGTHAEELLFDDAFMSGYAASFCHKAEFKEKQHA